MMGYLIFKKQCLFLLFVPLALAAMNDHNVRQFGEHTNSSGINGRGISQDGGRAASATLPISPGILNPIVCQPGRQSDYDNERCYSEQCALLTVNQGLLQLQPAYLQALRSDNEAANVILNRLQQYCRDKSVMRIRTLPGISVPPLDEFYSLCSQISQWPGTLTSSDKKRELYQKIKQTQEIRLKLLAGVAAIKPEVIDNISKLLFGIQPVINELREFNDLISSFTSFSALQGKINTVINSCKAVRTNCADLLCDLLLNVTIDPELSSLYATLMHSFKPWVDAFTNLIRILKICQKPVSENTSLTCMEHIRKAKLLAGQLTFHLEEIKTYISKLISGIRMLQQGPPMSSNVSARKIWIRLDYPLADAESEEYKSIIEALINSPDWVEKRLVRTQVPSSTNVEKKKDDLVEPPMDLQGVAPELMELALGVQGSAINSLVQHEIKDRTRMRVLLHGKPGVGKTTIAEVLSKKYQLTDKANGQECRPVYYLNIAYCKDSWANPVQHRFEPTIERLKNKNGILILDEIDAICEGNDTQTVGQAMNMLDVPEYSNVSVIFIANNIEKLPDVIKSRTKPIIEVVKPDFQNRARLVHYFLHLWTQKLEPDCLEASFIDELARATDDFSIRDIENLLTLAQQEKFARTSSAATRIARQDLLKAVTAARPGLTMSEIWKGAKNIAAMLDVCTRNPLVAQGVLTGLDYLRSPQAVQPEPVQPCFWDQHNLTGRIIDTGQQLVTYAGQRAARSAIENPQTTITYAKWICRIALMLL